MNKKKSFDRNKEIYGCGYYSVCIDGGFGCPCATTAKTNDGYDEAVHDSLKAEQKRQLDEFYLQ